MSVILAPSLLAADFANLAQSIKTVENAGAQWIHLDVMDYHFVPNLTFGAGTIKALRPYSSMVFDAHLMVENPEIYLDSFASAGVDIFTFHQEAVPDAGIGLLIDKIHHKGMKAGISVKPGTDVESIFPYLEKLDLILIMSVEPGFGGQKFMANMLPKVEKITALKKEKGYSYVIEIDGGINRDTAPQALSAGVEALVAGTAVFGKDNIDEEVKYYLTL